jgi:shikimate kinase
VNVYLVGMPGSGKSEVGSRLAERLGVEHLDTDAMVQRDAGKSVTSIFADEGEATFRELEARAILSTSTDKPAVVSCGGGAILSAENLKVMRAVGKIVWLQVPLDLLESRVTFGADRPLLGSAGDLARLMAEREPLYRDAADLVVAAGAEPAAVAEEIYDALRAASV